MFPEVLLKTKFPLTENQLCTIVMVSNYGLKEFASLKVNLIDLATAALPSQFVKHKKTSAHLLIKIRPTFSS